MHPLINLYFKIIEMKDDSRAKPLEISHSSGWKNVAVLNPLNQQSQSAFSQIVIESFNVDPVTLASGEQWEASITVNAQP
jgi:hypothetical protein